MSRKTPGKDRKISGDRIIGGSGDQDIDASERSGYLTGPGVEVASFSVDKTA
jgi:hypothetical protein